VNGKNLLAAFALAAALAACGGASSSGTFTAPPPSNPLTLKFDAQPSSGLAGQAMTVKVSVRDASGHASGAGNVTLALGTNPAGSALVGTVTRAAVNGVATFDDLVIVKAGQGYTLTANGQGMTPATSDAFSLSYSMDENETVVNSNDTPAHALAITPDIPMFGNLSSLDDVDFYKFHATAGQILSVSSYATRLNLANWDTSLELHLIAPDATTELWRMSASDWGITSIDNGCAAIRIPADGDYFLGCNVDASGSLLSATAKYALLVKLSNPAVAPQMEAATGHDSIANAQAISPGIVAGKYDSATSDSDYYKIDVQTVPTRVHLDLVATRNGVANDGAGFDPVMELQDGAGTVLWNNDDTVLLDPAIDYVVTTAGTYYVRVTQVGVNPASSPYLLSYDATAYAPPSQAGASSPAAALAAPIAYGQTVHTSFANAGGGQQLFAFEGNAGDLVRLWVDDKSVAQDATLQMDPSLPADAMFVAEDGTTALSAGSQPSQSLPATASQLNVRQTILPKQDSGTYFVRVSSPAGGTFGFHLERVAAAGSMPGWISGVLPGDGKTPSDANKNHHTVHAEEGQLVTVSLLGGEAPSGAMQSPFGNWGSAILPTVQVLDGQGKVVSATSADRLGASNYAESMLRPEAMLETSFRAPAAGDYDVVVADANRLGGSAFFYALQVWKNQ